MTKRLSDVELAAIRERAEKATAGEWFTVAETIVQCMGEDTLWSDAHHIASCERKEDAEFITKARQDIPKLLAEIERLRNEIIRLRRITHLSCPNCIEDCAAWVGHGVPCGKDW